jgi:tripartite-type tricarboxylate transporter receptor subunit TctC
MTRRAFIAATLSLAMSILPKRRRTPKQLNAAVPFAGIRILVGQQPGAPSDIIARLVAEKLSDMWGQSVVVENQAGASGTIGAELVAKAPANGYTC